MFSDLATHPWAYPALEAVHVLGIGLLLGNLLLLELRVWGLNRALPLEPLARATLVLALAGFGLAAASGLLMFATRAVDLIANPAFVWKMGLLCALGLNAALFHARGGVRRVDAVARGLLLLSLLGWMATLAAGRWIAYV